MARAAMRPSTGSRRRSRRRVVAGPKTNLGFLRALADAPEFRAGRFDTGFIDANLEALGAVEQPLDEEAARLGALMLIDDEWETLEARRSSLAPAEGFNSPWSERDGFELGPPRSHGLSVAGRGPSPRHERHLGGRRPRGRIRKRRLALHPERISSTTTAPSRAPTAD